MGRAVPGKAVIEDHDPLGLPAINWFNRNGTK
jgi:hypothetical protein